MNPDLQYIYTFIFSLHDAHFLTCIVHKDTEKNLYLLPQLFTVTKTLVVRFFPLNVSGCQMQHIVFSDESRSKLEQMTIGSVYGGSQSMVPISHCFTEAYSHWFWCDSVGCYLSQQLNISHAHPQLFCVQL